MRHGCLYTPGGWERREGLELVLLGRRGKQMWSHQEAAVLQTQRFLEEGVCPGDVCWGRAAQVGVHAFPFVHLSTSDISP